MFDFGEVLLWQIMFLLDLLKLLTGRFFADAAAQGVLPDQIILTDVAMKNEHIRRSSLADPFLDT